MARRITEIRSLWTFLGDFLLSVHSITAAIPAIMITDRIKGGLANETKVLPCSYNQGMATYD